MRFLFVLLLLPYFSHAQKKATDTMVTAEVEYRSDSVIENGDTTVVVSINRIKVMAESKGKKWEVPVEKLTPEFREWLFDMRKRKKVTGFEEYTGGRMIK